MDIQGETGKALGGAQKTFARSMRMGSGSTPTTMGKIWRSSKVVPPTEQPRSSAVASPFSPARKTPPSQRSRCTRCRAGESHA